MSEINKNNITPNQYYSTAKGPFDSKQTPADSYAELIDLARIPRANRYPGLTVTVLNNGNPIEYWLVGGTTNAAWKIKTGNVVPDKASLLALSPSACTVGLEMVVQSDESSNNELTKYWVTSVNGGEVTWEKKNYGNVTVTGEDIENN